jgi:hypothetical protein
MEVKLYNICQKLSVTYITISHRPALQVVTVLICKLFFLFLFLFFVFVVVVFVFVSFRFVSFRFVSLRAEFSYFWVVLLFCRFVVLLVFLFRFSFLIFRFAFGSPFFKRTRNDSRLAFTPLPVHPHAHYFI